MLPLPDMENVNNIKQAMFLWLSGYVVYDVFTKKKGIEVENTFSPYLNLDPLKLPDVPHKIIQTIHAPISTFQVSMSTKFGFPQNMP